MAKQTRSNKNTRTGSRSSMQTRGSESEDMDSDLHRLFLDEIADAYNAEQQLTKALPKMAQAADSDELRDLFETHLEETKGHVARLEQLAEELDEKIKRKICTAMQGIIEEGQEIMKEQKGSSALDAGLIAAAQKVEHYEIATYGTLRAWAEQLGHREAEELLRQTLDEEKSADDKLTGVADTLANQKARTE